MQKELSELIDVRSIVTLALTLVFCELAVTGTVTAGQYLSVFTVVISFYFGTQYEKRRGSRSDEDDSDE